MSNLILTRDDIAEIKKRFLEGRGTSSEQQERKRERFEKTIDDYIAENVSKRPGGTDV